MKKRTKAEDFECTCPYCKQIFLVDKPSQKKKRKFCSKSCSAKYHNVLNRRHCTKANNPEWAAKISATAKANNDRMLGENNPMKRLDVAAKVSKTRSEKFKNDPEFKKKVSEYTRNAWKKGLYDHVNVGRCRWYNHVKPDSTVVKLQGTWEVIFATWLDGNDINYSAHRGKISYIDRNGLKRTYLPDFYVPEHACYYDVKGAWFTEIQKEKFSCIRESNKDIVIKIVDREEFGRLGINVDKESHKIHKNMKG